MLIPRGIAKPFRDGTHRATAPEQTLARVAPHLATMGITRVADVTGLDCIGLPVVMVCRPASRSLAVTQGKGLTLAAARVSGVMEALESHHAQHVRRPLLYASHDQLRRRHRVIDVDRLPKPLSSSFHSARSYLWIEGFDLLAERPTWVPFETVHTHYACPDIRPGCFATGSNGLASGNHLLEAISHGLCEVIERDATALWRLLDHDRQAATMVDLDTVDDPACCHVLDLLDRGGVAAAVWETTTDIGVPCFSAMIADRVCDPAKTVRAGSGMGCHPTRGIALLRALTEAAQGRLTMIAGSRDDTFPDEYARLRAAETPLPATAPSRAFSAAPDHVAATFDDDVAWELDRLRAVGIEQVVAVDLTDPDIGVPVVRVVVPGLEYGGERFDHLPGPRARARTVPREHLS